MQVRNQMVDDFINPNEAGEGYDKIIKVVKRLLKNSHGHLKIGEYSNSIPLSILALEETAKADYLHMANKNNKGISRKEWENLTSGGKSHITKLMYMTDKRAKSLERWSEDDIQAMNYYNSKIGFVSKYPNKSAIKQETEFFRKIIPKLKNLKEDCFYTSWIHEERKWNYFDRRFPENIKKFLATYLYFEARKGYFLQLLWFDFPRKKMLKDYSEDEWSKIMNSPNRKEVISSQNELIKCVRGKYELLINALSGY